MDLRLELTDDYAVRNGMVTQLYNHACRWLDLAIGRAPIEMQTILQVNPVGLLCPTNAHPFI
jgi:phosphatidylinositol 4-kinase